jgi:hypothetical protein
MWTELPARTIAACAAAALAAPALAATSRYAGGATPAPSAAPRSEAANLARPQRGAARIHLADTGNARPWSFFDSLFSSPPRSAPPPRRRPSAYRSWPRRDQQRDGRGRQGRIAPGPARASAVPPVDTGPSGGATYRTMCVRLCDGYFWPVSFATHDANFGRDSETCTKSCGAPAALYYYPNPGGAPEDMVSLEGVPYKSLGTAFRFRDSYDASCKCRPHPWETEAVEHHQENAQP